MAAASEKEAMEERMKAWSKEFGFPLPPYNTRANVERLSAVHEDDIFVCSYPKSGTNWLKQIVRGIVIRGDPEQVLKDEELDLCDICPILEADPAVDHDNMARPRVYHTHVRYPDVPKGGRVIYIARDLLDVAASTFKFYTSMRPMGPSYTKDVQANLMMTGMIVGGGWDLHLRSFLEARDDPHMLIVKFEDLKKDAEGQILRIANFLGVDLDAAALARVVDLSSFESMKKNEKRIMGKEYLARLRGAPPESQDYTLVNQGQVGHADSFTAETRAAVDKFWAEKLAPYVGAASYDELEAGVSPSGLHAPASQGG